MRVLLVNARRLDTPNHLLGILYIAAVLEKEGHEVKVLDPYSDVSLDVIKKTVKEWKPDVVGISSTTPQINRALDIARVVKELSLPTILGGVHPTVMPREVLSDKNVDFVVVGEGEETMVELLEKKDWSKVKGISCLPNSLRRFAKTKK